MSKFLALTEVSIKCLNNNNKNRNNNNNIRPGHFDARAAVKEQNDRGTAEQQEYHLPGEKRQCYNIFFKSIIFYLS